MRAAIGIGITAYPGILKKEFPNNTILENVGFRATSFDGRETMHYSWQNVLPASHHRNPASAPTVEVYSRFNDQPHP
jgi:hypothetical protein